MMLYDAAWMVSDTRAHTHAAWHTQFYSPTDQHDFYSNFNVTQASSAHTNARTHKFHCVRIHGVNCVMQTGTLDVVGFNNASVPGGEAMLDIEWIVGVAPNVDSTFWSVWDPQQAYFILEWAAQVGRSSCVVGLAACPGEPTRWCHTSLLAQVSNITSPPLVHSISCAEQPAARVAGMRARSSRANSVRLVDGTSENDPTLPAGYITRSNLELVKLCLRGLTVVIASGTQRQRCGGGVFCGG
jgi:hypothetical protein